MSFPLTVLYVFTFGGTIPNDISSTSTIVSCTLPRLLLNVPFQCCNLSLCYFCVVFLYFLSLLKFDLYMCYFSDLGEHCNTVNISKTFTGQSSVSFHLSMFLILFKSLNLFPYFLHSLLFLYLIILVTILHKAAGFYYFYLDFHHYTKIFNITDLETHEGIFWISFFKVVFCYHLFSLGLQPGDMSYCRTWQIKTSKLFISRDREQREKDVSGSHNFFTIRYMCFTYTPSQYSTPGTTPLTHGPLDDIKYLTLSTGLPDLAMFTSPPGHIL